MSFIDAKPYIDNGDYQQAITILQQAISNDPNYAPSYFTLGAVYTQTGNNAEAIKNYNKAISIDPNYKEAYDGLYFI